MVALLADEALGPVHDRSIALDWTRSPLGELFVTAHVEIGGDFARAWCAPLDAATATAQRTAPDSTSRAQRVAARPTRVEQAEHLDWRLLLPFAANGHGEVLAAMHTNANTRTTPASCC